MHRFPLSLLLCPLLLAACVTTSAVPLDGTDRPPLDPDAVVVYLDEADVPGAYEKVALIYAEGDYALTDEAKLFRKVRKRAARLGANGVLVQEVKEPGTSAKVAHVVLGVQAERRAEMIAIYVTPGARASAE